MGNINSCPGDYYTKDPDNRYRGAAKAMSEDIKDVSMVDLREDGMEAEHVQRRGLQQQPQMLRSGELTQSFSQMKIETEGDMRRSLSGRHSTTLIFEYDDDIPTAKQLEDSGHASNSDVESADEDRIVPDNQEEDSSSLGESPAPQQRDLSSTPLPLLPGQEHRTEQRRLPSVMVPVELTWQQGGTKVYVTGSFTGWRKMIGLVPDPSRPKTFHIKLQLPPGTHRFRFIVDNELRFSDFLPTATDQMGNFVNYLEIVAPQMQKPPGPSANDEQQQLLQEPEHQVQLPPQTVQEQRVPVDAHSLAEDEDLHTEHIDYDNNARNQVPDSRQIVDDGFRTRSQLAMQIEEDPDDMGDGYSRFRENVKLKPEYEYTQDIPAVFTDPSVMGQYYLTLDQQQNNQQNLAWLTPPQLPPHLDHVILNMYNKSAEGGNENTSGALPIPNHVVLNHLATSSIKHNTLCVASIVRYKGKYATQILYAPLL